MIRKLRWLLIVALLFGALAALGYLSGGTDPHTAGCGCGLHR